MKDNEYICPCCSGKIDFTGYTDLNTITGGLKPSGEPVGHYRCRGCGNDIYIVKPSLGDRMMLEDEIRDLKSPDECPHDFKWERSCMLSSLTEEDIPEDNDREVNIYVCEDCMTKIYSVSGNGTDTSVNKFPMESSYSQTSGINDILGYCYPYYTLADVFSFLPSEYTFIGHTGYRTVDDTGIHYISIDNENDRLNVVLSSQMLENNRDIFDCMYEILKSIYKDN